MYTMPAPDSILRFGVFELDLRSGELRKNGVQVKVQESPLRALRLLVLHPQEVLSRQEIRHVLWGDNVFVDFDRAINTTINRLRETLNDVSSNPVFIETVARSGYRWIAPVQVVARVPEGIAPSEIPALASAMEKDAPAFVAERHFPSRLRWVVAAVLAVVAGGALISVGWRWLHPTSGAVSGESGSPASAPSLLKVNAATRAHDPTAEQLYLTGRYYWSKRTPDSLRQAEDAFTQAIVHDPSYAKAYVGLADTYNLMREFAAMSNEEAYQRAFAAASRAVELDDSSAEAHATLGFVSFWWKRDGKAADREFRRALTLNPAYVDAYHWYANILGCQGRLAEQREYFERAQELDPASPSIRADKGESLLIVGERAEGMALLKQIEASDPTFISPHLYLSQLYLAELDGRDYLSEERMSSRLRKRSDDMVVDRAAEKGFASGDSAGMLRSMLAVQKKMYQENRLSAYEVARTEALLGDSDAALRYLDIAVQRNEPYLSTMRVDLALQDLHRLPAFQHLLTRAGLPPFS